MPEQSQAEYDRYVDGVRKQLKHTPPRESYKRAGLSGELVVDDDRCDREWEQREADRIFEERPSLRVAAREERIAKRKRQTVGQRLDAVLTQLMSNAGGMRSRPVEMQRHSANDDTTGAPPGGIMIDESMSKHSTLIQHHLVQLEELLDSQDGVLLRDPPGAQGFYGNPGHAGGPTSRRMMTTAERDRMVFDEFQGIHSTQVAEEAPYLGTSARTIERARINEAKRRGVEVRPVDGTVLGGIAQQAA